MILIISGNRKMWRKKSLILEDILKGLRNYSSISNLGAELKRLRPLLVKRLEERARDHPPVKPTLPVAREVLRARSDLYDGVSTLIHHSPVWACKYCPEVYIGESGHLIRTCRGYKHHYKNKVHEWIKATTNDIVVNVESFHSQKKFQNVVKLHDRFDLERVPAVVELCLHAGVEFKDQTLFSSVITPYNDYSSSSTSLPHGDLRLIARQTINAWETLRSGVHKLLIVYPSRVCKHCKEVHVGALGQKSRGCGVFDNENHLWKKARVDDLIPSNVVWHRRSHDPSVLVDKGREYYGHAPAVVDLCSKFGALVPSKYFCMMKVDGLTTPYRI